VLRRVQWLNKESLFKRIIKTSHAMSDFFGGLRNSSSIAGPDAVFDQGSIWPSASGPHGGYSGQPDGRINATSSLLDNMQPYSYGSAARLGTSAMGANVPHNVQKIVPEIRLPDSGTVADAFTLSHAVSDGGVAFVLRYDSHETRAKAITHHQNYLRQGLSRAVDHVVSLSVVNYILAGLQERQYYHHMKRRNANLNSLNPQWDDYARMFGYNLQQRAAQVNDNRSIHQQRFDLAKTFIRDHARPFGVVVGSDKQGGQHQGGNSIVTFPVDFVVTCTVDGLSENMQNYWGGYDVASGEELQYVLVPESSRSLMYDLNSYKHRVRKNMRVNSMVYQLRPITQTQRHHLLVENPNSPHLYDYWHFATSQKLHQARLDPELEPGNGRYGTLDKFHRGALMQTNVSPEFYDNLGRNVDDPNQNGNIVKRWTLMTFGSMMDTGSCTTCHTCVSHMEDESNLKDQQRPHFAKSMGEIKRSLNDDNSIPSKRHAPQKTNTELSSQGAIPSHSGLLGSGTSNAKSDPVTDSTAPSKIYQTASSDPDSTPVSVASSEQTSAVDIPVGGHATPITNNAGKAATRTAGNLLSRGALSKKSQILRVGDRASHTQSAKKSAEGQE
jgi:hypothetical protein